MAHNFPAVVILLVLFFVFGPAIRKMLRGGANANAGMPTAAEQPRAGARANFARMAEIARELDPNDPEQIKALLAQMQGQGSGTQGGQFANASSGSISAETTFAVPTFLGTAASALASAAQSAALRGTADPILAAAIEAARLKRQQKRHPKPPPDLQISTPDRFGPRAALAPIAPLRPLKMRAPMPMLAARAPQRPITL